MQIDEMQRHWTNVTYSKRRHRLLQPWSASAEEREVAKESCLTSSVLGLAALPLCQMSCFVQSIGSPLLGEEAVLLAIPVPVPK